MYTLQVCFNGFWLKCMNSGESLKFNEHGNYSSWNRPFFSFPFVSTLVNFLIEVSLSLSQEFIVKKNNTEEASIIIEIFWFFFSLLAFSGVFRNLYVLCNGWRQTIGEAKTGDVVGEIGMLCYRPQLFTVRTKRLSQLLRLNRTSFLNIVQANVGDGTIIMNNILQVCKRFVTNHLHFPYFWWEGAEGV